MRVWHTVRRPQTSTRMHLLRPRLRESTCWVGPETGNAAEAAEEEVLAPLVKHAGAPHGDVDGLVREGAVENFSGVERAQVGQTTLAVGAGQDEGRVEWAEPELAGLVLVVLGRLLVLEVEALAVLEGNGGCRRGDIDVRAGHGTLGPVGRAHGRLSGDAAEECEGKENAKHWSGLFSSMSLFNWFTEGFNDYAQLVEG